MCLNARPAQCCMVVISNAVSKDCQNGLILRASEVTMFPDSQLEHQTIETLFWVKAPFSS
jgi:hypothetical protein